MLACGYNRLFYYIWLHSWLLLSTYHDDDLNGLLRITSTIDLVNQTNHSCHHSKGFTEKENVGYKCMHDKDHTI